MLTKLSFIVVLCSVISAAVHHIRGMTACPWVVFWIVAIIALLVLIKELIAQKISESILRDIEECGVMDEFKASIEETARKIADKLEDENDKR